MDIKQCRQCGKLFQYIGNPVCAECLEEIDKMFIKVRDHIYKHPDDTMQQVSEKTEVPVKQILNFLKQDRLSLSTADGVLMCELCKKPITRGRFCDGCRETLAQEADSIPIKAKAPPVEEPIRRGSRMYINKTKHDAD